MAPLKTHHSRLAICSLRQLEAQRQQPPSTSNVSVREILSPIMAPVPLPHQLSPDQSVTAGNSTTHPDVMKGLCQDDDDRHEPRDPSGEFLNQDAVDVAEAERNFSELSRQLNHASAHTDDLSKELTYATPFSYQFKVVMNRTNLSFLRNANYEATRVFNHVAVALITGLTYMNLPPNVAGVQSRVFTIFQLIVLLPLIMAQVEPAFIFARQIYLRESSAKMYTPITFGISQSVAEMPYSLCCAVGFFVIWYYLPNLQGGGLTISVEYCSGCCRRAVRVLSFNRQVGRLASNGRVLLFSAQAVICWIPLQPHDTSTANPESIFQLSALSLITGAETLGSCVLLYAPIW
ncbi:hypothetical protein MJO28_003575 [Puccinia striiformis f. sp. tritici]|uniref:Uncharacterized protein n=1 Tax=Puccinia striiformis f. sp. tritici TaxID=168172 RepID=A0ACC0EMN4_9BASI|nr:hypothetical protein MJO28_003575 [Puccinia striiformis f. sp. tritici]